ncbi:ABC transporter substrate-binding protein [Tardiphaga sp. 538_B7_N1_4]|uniref:ABC transporter substrate-binding protein n=1 Tax=Tardiphaga sp. 538_B7_N1_4 TaxID=3240778 RepID=UPI003F209B29
MNKMRVILNLLVAASIAVVVASTTASAQKKYDPGATDTEIKIGQTAPFSGPGSAYSAVAKTNAAYIRMINDAGGVNGRKINLIQYDDAYSPPKTVEQVRKLVESDEVLFTFQIVGTASNAAVQKYLNLKGIPQMFPASGAVKFSDSKNFPWTIGFNHSYIGEARIYAQFILDNYPNAKIGVIYQNDDFGKDYLAGLKLGLGEKAAKMIVGTESFEMSDPTIDSQIVKLKTMGADLVFNAATAKFAAQGIRKIASLGWKPVHILNINAVSIGAVLQPAGLENAKDVISANYIKDTQDARWKDDPGMKRYLAFMAKYNPEGDKDSIYNPYAYNTSQLLIEILKRCGDDLTRENILRQATNMKGIQLDMVLPGILGHISPTDYPVYKQFQMMKFDGARWEMFGPILEDKAGG